MYQQNNEQEPLNQQVVVAPPQHAFEPGHQQIIVVPLEQEQPQQAPPARAHVVNARVVNDDPTCLYIGACISLFVPFVGFILMCCYACGEHLGPRQRRAFSIMAICTIIGCLINLILGLTQSTDAHYNYDKDI